MTARDFLIELVDSCFSTTQIRLHDAGTGSQAMFTASDLDYVLNHEPVIFNKRKVYLIRVSVDVIHIYII